MAIDLEALQKDGEINKDLTPSTEEREISMSLDHKLGEEKLKGLEQDREERKAYANKIFSFVKWYMIVVAAFISLSAVEYVPFNIPEKIQLMILGTTTTNVLGMFYFVAKYLFPNRS